MRTMKSWQYINRVIWKRHTEYLLSRPLLIEKEQIMSPQSIMKLLKEAVAADKGGTRISEIQAVLQNGVVNFSYPHVSQAWRQLLGSLFVETAQNCPSALPGLYPFFCKLCGDAIDPPLFPEIDWSLMPSAHQTVWDAKPDHEFASDIAFYLWTNSENGTKAVCLEVENEVKQRADNLRKQVLYALNLFWRCEIEDPNSRVYVNIGSEGIFFCPHEIGKKYNLFPDKEHRVDAKLPEYI